VCYNSTTTDKQIPVNDITKTTSIDGKTITCTFNKNYNISKINIISSRNIESYYDWEYAGVNFEGYSQSKTIWNLAKNDGGVNELENKLENINNVCTDKITFEFNSTDNTYVHPRISDIYFYSF
jgi:hypothetical protein